MTRLVVVAIVATLFVSACSTGGERTVTVTVPAGSSGSATTAGEDGQADVAVEASGLRQDGGALGYGIVLTNRSADGDALDLTLTVNILAEDGEVLTTETHSIPAVPANSSVAVGRETSVPDGTRAAELDISVAEGASGPPGWQTPKVGPIRLLDFSSIDEGVGVSAQIENTTDRELTAGTDVGIVFLDEGGNVLGGIESFLEAAIPPGSRAADSVSGSATPNEDEIGDVLVSVHG